MWLGLCDRVFQSQEDFGIVGGLGVVAKFLEGVGQVERRPVVSFVRESIELADRSDDARPDRRLEIRVLGLQ